MGVVAQAKITVQMGRKVCAVAQGLGASVEELVPLSRLTTASGIVRDAEIYPPYSQDPVVKRNLAIHKHPSHTTFVLRTTPPLGWRRVQNFLSLLTVLVQAQPKPRSTPNAGP